MARLLEYESTPEMSQRRAVESQNPATGEIWKSYDPPSAEAIHEAYLRARAAQKEWVARSLGERKRILEEFRRIVVARRAAILSDLQRETGKPRAEALIELVGALNFVRFNCKNLRRAVRPQTYRASTAAMLRKTIRITYNPHGVIGLITPWNYPLLLPAGVLVPALLTGNAVLLKPSEYTPSTAVLLGELLRDAGLPEGVLQVLPGDGATGAALVREPVDKVFFIGSEAAGRKVALSCAERMIPYVLELGGSDPAIVLRDADLDTAALGIVWGRFFNAGQTCVAPKRILVEETVYDRFVEKVAARVRALRAGGAEADVGPMIRESQLAALEKQYRDAIGRGAKEIAQSPGPGAENPRFFPPSVLVDVPAEARVLRDETFGPILPVVRVRDAEEAIARANDTNYGLSASIWSKDITRARELAARLDAGSVMINDSVFVAGMADVPYGGVKASGMGRSHGLAGLMECVQSKTLVIDPWPAWRQAYWYSYSQQMTEGLDNYLQFEHGRGIFARVVAGIRAVRALYFGRD